MTELQVIDLLQLIREVIFYLRVLCLSTSFVGGIIFFKLLIQTKNQRDLI